MMQEDPEFLIYKKNWTRKVRNICAPVGKHLFKHTVYIKLASFPFTTSLTADTNRKIEIPHKPQNFHSKMPPRTIYSYFPSYHCPW